MSQPDKEVVVVLPILSGKVLMQLRDLKPWIDAPGCWGFFGGAIGTGEPPDAAARRELLEEIGLDADSLELLGSESITDLDGIYAHAYTCSLDVPLEGLRLTEGMDFKLVSIDEILERSIYSERLQSYFPTVSTYFIEKTVRKSLAFWRET